MIKKSIPHIFTSLNLIAGCLAVYFAFSHQFNAALLFVLLGVFFDFFDGFFARLLGVESELGVQLDSMADLITSGVAPGALMYQLFLLSGVKINDYTLNISSDISIVLSFTPLALIGFTITLGAAFRLSRFNLLEEKLPYFKGIPAPANAILIMGLPFVFQHPNLVVFKAYLMNPISLMICCTLSIFLMNIHWKMFSLKTNEGMLSFLFPVLLLIGATLMFLLYGLAAISGTIILYVVLSSIKYLFKI
ncbi:MAG: CDP-alcohol phosphatidyltransferase family protein [Flavobacteriaceae bacterium]|jgi:CDP-diacylglycerol--serine O-phosphatidyltransferase|nr:CDP-alcohol phosphatidyltransferase family protein [Flavobacteriaceae bacterium]